LDCASSGFYSPALKVESEQFHTFIVKGLTALHRNLW
jgi:hypothetical protein